MYLRKSIAFKGSSVEGYALTPADDMVCVVRLVAPLGVESAGILGFEWAMNESIARDADVSLKQELEATEFTLPGLDKMKALVCHKLKLKRTKDATFNLHMIAKFPIEHAGDLQAFIINTNKDTFTLKIRSTQKEMFEEPAEEPAAEEIPADGNRKLVSHRSGKDVANKAIAAAKGPVQ